MKLYKLTPKNSGDNGILFTYVNDKNPDSLEDTALDCLMGDLETTWSDYFELEEVVSIEDVPDKLRTKEIGWCPMYMEGVTPETYLQNKKDFDKINDNRDILDT